MADRADWEKATVQQRHLAVAADAELRRRHPGQHHPPLRSAEPQPATQAQRAELALAAGQPIPQMGQWIKDQGPGTAQWPALAERLTGKAPGWHDSVLPPTDLRRLPGCLVLRRVALRLEAEAPGLTEVPSAHLAGHGDRTCRRELRQARVCGRPTIKYHQVMLYDFFIAHAGEDGRIADDLYKVLTSLGARCFLDTRNLRPGDDWDLALPKAQAQSKATVAIVSAARGRAFYQREEIAAAVALSRSSPDKHRVIPVFVGDRLADDIPYGLRLKHPLYLNADSDASNVADRLMQVLHFADDESIMSSQVMGAYEIDLQGQVESLLTRAALTKSELLELLALEPDRVVTASQLVGGIRRVWPGVVGLGQRTPGNVREAALYLLDCPDAPEGLRRLLGFVDWLAEAAGVYEAEDSSLARQLRDWAERVGDAHHVTAAPWRTPTKAALHKEPALLIELEPTTADRFTVHLWLWIPGLGTRTLEWDDEPYRLDELRARVDDLLELASRELFDTEGALRLEFVLNLENVHYDVDWWLSDVEEGQADDGRGVPLGAEYAVIVRPKRRKFKEMWLSRRRWRALEGATKPITDLAVWITDAATPAEDLWSRFVDKPEKVFIAPLGAGERPDDGMKRLLGLATIRYGVPVALCLRRTPVGPSPGLDRLATALADAQVADLPELVRTWRRQAYLEKGDHFGRDLVLLWDEFDKARDWPPSNTGGQLAMPAVRGAS